MLFIYQLYFNFNITLGKQFNYKPRDFELVKTVTSIAERSTDCNIAFFPPSMYILKSS